MRFGDLSVTSATPMKRSGQVHAGGTCARFVTSGELVLSKLLAISPGRIIGYAKACEVIWPIAHSARQKALAEHGALEHSLPPAQMATLRAGTVFCQKIGEIAAVPWHRVP